MACRLQRSRSPGHLNQRLRDLDWGLDEVTAQGPLLALVEEQAMEAELESRLLRQSVAEKMILGQELVE